jgi:hypothetical protein
MNLPKPLKPLIPVAVSLLTFAVVLWVLGWAGLLSGSSSVATVSLTGAFVTTLVTLVGIFVKQAADERAETRLKLEAGISAIQLFAGPDGKPSLPTQRAGALLMLSSLGHHHLTLALGAVLLPSKELDAASAARIIGSAMEGGDESIRRYAVNLFVGQAPKLVTPTGFEAPEPILNGCEGYSSYVRLWAAVGIVRLLTSRELGTWREKYPYPLNAAVSALALLWQNEPDGAPGKRNLAAILHAALVELVPGSDATLGHPRKDISLAAARTDTEDMAASGKLACAAVSALHSLAEGEVTSMSEVFADG